MDLNRLFAQAVAHQNAGRPAEAVALYRQIAAVAPEPAGLWWNLGICLKQLDRPAEALEAYRAAAERGGTFKGLDFSIGQCLQRLGRMADAAQAFEKAVAAEPDDPTTRYNLAAAHREIGNLAEAAKQAEAAIMLEPGFLAAQLHLAKIRTAMLPTWHMPMMNDAARNAAYREAIAKVVRPGDIVLEIGTGSGLLAMLAVQAGARHVVTCESVPWIAETAKRIVRLNGMADRITVVEALSTDPGLSLPEKADVLLSEIFSSDLLSERVLDAVEDARERHLKPDARLIPLTAEVRCALVGGADLERHVHVEQVEGFDLSPFNRLFPRVLRVDRPGLAMELLSQPVSPFTFDFTAPLPEGSETKTLTLRADKPGRAVGVVQWIRFALADGVVFENHPLAETGASGWQVGVYLAAQPMTLVAGDPVTVGCFHDGHNVWLAPEQ